jgi:hypothetical protein
VSIQQVESSITASTTEKEPIEKVNGFTAIEYQFIENPYLCFELQIGRVDQWVLIRCQSSPSVALAMSCNEILKFQKIVREKGSRRAWACTPRFVAR